MGKRIAFVGTILTVLSVALITHAAHAPQGTTLTQEDITPNTVSTLHDTVLERSITFKVDSGAAQQSIDVWVTAYTSDPAETDDTPFITASGSLVREGVAAANFLPMGTQFRIPEKFGDKVFTVEDRMNARYNNQHIVDLWFDNKDSAKVFGKRYLTLEVL